MDFDAAIAEYQEVAKNQIHIQYVVLLKNGVHHPTVPLIRERLRVLGDLVAEHTGNIYDDVIEDSVREFQKRNTLKVDGIAGPQTFNYLNSALPDQLKALGMSKAKWDAIPKTEGKKIIVNIPGFECWVFENDVFLFKSKCVVGRTDRKTVEFVDKITYADFRPYWNVPVSIFRRDKMPKILKYGPKYLVDNHYEVINNRGRVVDPYKVNWAKYRNKTPPYRLRQTPGDWNALGLVKYMFPNSYNIYMHDTPSKSLFDRDSRTFSSGCIRLQDPVRIGSFLLDIPEDEVVNMMNDKKNNHHIVNLEESVPIYITYMTSWIEPDSTIRFAPDVYRKTPMKSDDFVLRGHNTSKKLKSHSIQLGQPLKYRIKNR